MASSAKKLFQQTPSSRAETFRKDQMQRTKYRTTITLPVDLIKMCAVGNPVGKNICYQEKECRHQQYQSQIKSNQIPNLNQRKRKNTIKTNKLFRSFSLHSYSLLPFLNPSAIWPAHTTSSLLEICRPVHTPSSLVV